MSRIMLKDILLMLEYSDGAVKKLMTKWKMENDSLIEPQMRYYMDEFEKRKSNPAFTKGPDINKYTFQEIEHIIDAHFPKKNGNEKFNTSGGYAYQDDIILNNNELLVLKGDSKNKCIRYGKGESWCISRDNISNMYHTYRIGDESKMFYFVIDKQLPETAPNKKIVVMVDDNGKYYIADSGNGNDVGFGKNSGSDEVKWEHILKIQPKLSNYQSLFERMPLSQEDRYMYEKVKDEVSDETFKNFTFDEKEAYIGFPHDLTVGQLDILDKMPNGKLLIKKYAISTNGVNLTNEMKDKYLTPSDKRILIDNILQSENVENYTINSDGVVDVSDYLTLEGREYTKIPIKFGKVGGDFYCSNNEFLISLEGSPNIVGGDFFCDENDSLISLKGAPNIVHGFFECMYNNSLISLEGAPQTIGGNFNCNGNTSLKSLKGVPKNIGGDFIFEYNTSLISFNEFPKEIGGNVIVRNNRLKVSEKYIRSISNVRGSIKLN